MKAITFFITFASACIIISTSTQARWESKSTGLTFRSSYWHANSEHNRIRVTDGMSSSDVHVGGVGGWLTMFSRYNEKMWLEFSLGGVANVNVVEQNYYEDIVDVRVITPVLLGVRYDLLAIDNPSAFRPYLSGGGGPYWISDIHVEDRLMEEEVEIDTKLKRGAYAGVGFNFMLCNWCAINLDMRYHFINLKQHHPDSGYEAGLGISFMWGSYQ